MPARSSRRRAPRPAAAVSAGRPVHALLLCLLGAGLYANSLDVPFTFDDIPNIVANPRLQIETLAPGALLDAALGNRSPRPVAHASFALNRWAGGLDVTGYHAVNVAIHCIDGVLVYGVALALLRLQLLLPGQRVSALQRRSVPAMALLAGAIFVAHPLQTQSVTYVVQRMTGLAALFALASYLLFLRGRSCATPRRRTALFAAAGLAWLLALGSKQVAALLPVALWLTEWTFFRDLDRTWLRRGMALLAVSAAALLLLAFVYLGADPLERILAGYGERSFTPGERVLTQARVLVLYLSLMALPLPGRLSLLHPFAPSRSLLDPPSTLAAMLALAALLAVAVWAARERRLVCFCILWFFVWNALESSPIPLEMAFEHRCYLPMFGAALLASWLLFSLPERRRGWVNAAAFSLVGLLTAGSVARNQDWRNPVAFWSELVAENPDRRRARTNLAGELLKRGRVGEAVVQYREALRLDPNASAHSNLGVALARQGRLDEAERQYREALRLEPDSARLHNNLGALMERRGERDEAESQYRESLRLDPGYGAARRNLERLVSGAPRSATSSRSSTSRTPRMRGSSRSAVASWLRASSKRRSWA